LTHVLFVRVDERLVFGVVRLGVQVDVAVDHRSEVLVGETELAVGFFVGRVDDRLRAVADFIAGVGVKPLRALGLDDQRAEFAVLDLRDAGDVVVEVDRAFFVGEPPVRHSLVRIRPLIVVVPVREAVGAEDVEPGEVRVNRAAVVEFVAKVDLDTVADVRPDEQRFRHDLAFEYGVDVLFKDVHPPVGIVVAAIVIDVCGWEDDNVVDDIRFCRRRIGAVRIDTSVLGFDLVGDTRVGIRRTGNERRECRFLLRFRLSGIVDLRQRRLRRHLPFGSGDEVREAEDVGVER
jgi:hypothetical protein